MRHFIRHPSQIPILCSAGPQGGARRRSRARNLSTGGLCFESRRPYVPGSWLHIQIPLKKPPFEADVEVVWVSRERGGYQVGVRFRNDQEHYSARMVEQICHIEQYRKEVMEKEGRRLTSEQAAQEWIERYAAEFPN